MKVSSLLLLGQAVIACLALPALGQTCHDSGARARSAALGEPVRATEIIGSVIKNAQNEKLGTVVDFAVDLQNGRIVELVVARGGFMDQKLVAVPSENFHAEDGGKTLRCNLDKGKLDSAPEVDLLNWEVAMAQSSVEQVYQHFGDKPYFLDAEFLSTNARDFQRAGKVVHLSTLNQQDQNLGKVADIVVDLPAGRVIEVVIASGRVLGIRDELSPVPPQALNFDSGRSVLTLNTTARALAEAPHFSARAWPRIDRGQIGAVYRAYSAYVMPYFVPAGFDDLVQNISPSGFQLEGQ